MGPFVRDELLALIKKGELGPQDEVCCNGRYWIYLYEELEVWNQLGIRVPKAKGDDEEVTDTGTARTQVLQDNGEPRIVEEFDPDQTAILSNKSTTMRKAPASTNPEKPAGTVQSESYRIFQKPDKFASPEGGQEASFIGKVQVSGHAPERLSIIKGLFFVLSLVAIGALVLLFNKIKDL